DVLQTSNSGAVEDGGIGAAGYADSQALEFSNQRSVRRLLTGDETITTASGPATVFETKVRLSDIQGDQSTASTSHSFSMVLGENLGWNSGSSSNQFIVLTDSTALAVVFYQTGGVKSVRVSNGSQGL